MYFTTLLQTPATPHPPGVVLSWLAAPAEYFLNGGGTTDVCATYLRCISTYVHCLTNIAIAESGDVGGNTVISIIKAAGKAATKCRDNRALISSSGIISTLAQLSSCWEEAAKQQLLEGGGDSSATSSKQQKQRSASNNNSSVTSTTAKQKMKTCALTPYHAELMRCCVLAGQYRFAYSFAELHPINFVGPMRSMSAAASSSGGGGGMAGLDPVEAADGIETYLTYFYYYGMVCVGCDDYELAAHCFRICVSAPSQVVSAISIAARKKLLLIQCLLVEEYGLAAGSGGGYSEGSAAGKGKDKKDVAMELPAASSPCVIRYMSGSSVKGGTFGATGKPESAAEGPVTTTAAGAEGGTTAPSTSAQSASSSTAAVAGGRPVGGRRDRSKEKNYYHLGRYHDIVVAYLNDNAEHLDFILDDTAELLAYDGNLGLAKRVKDSIAWRNVAKTASVYEVVALEKIGSTTTETKIGDIGEKRKKAEDLLLEILSEGKADCSFGVKIDQESGVVYFPREGDGSWDDDDEDMDRDEDDEQLEGMASRVKECMALAQRIRELDTALTASNRYQTLVIRDRTAKGLATVGGKASGGGSSTATEAGGASLSGGSGPRGVAELGRSGPMDTFD